MTVLNILKPERVSIVYICACGFCLLYYFSFFSPSSFSNYGLLLANFIDPEMQLEIDTNLSKGQATFIISLLVGLVLVLKYIYGQMIFNIFMHNLIHLSCAIK